MSEPRTLGAAAEALATARGEKTSADRDASGICGHSETRAIDHDARPPRRDGSTHAADGDGAWLRRDGGAGAADGDGVEAADGDGAQLRCDGGAGANGSAQSSRGRVVQAWPGRTAAEDRALAYLRSRRRRWRRIVFAMLAAATALLVYAHRARLRHLAVPVLSAAPRPAGAPATRIVDKPLGGAALVGRVRSRVTGMVRDGDGSLLVATFDQGVYRLSGIAPPVELGALEGRERFVNAITIYKDDLVAATYRGAIVIGKDGLRRDTFLADRAVESLLHVGDHLLAGTERGVYALPGTLLALDEPVRASALAFENATLYIGSPSGIYTVSNLDLTGAPLHATWRPIVFGEPGAETNVVTALASWSDGVLAGTDDGGVVRVDHKRARATRFGEPRANEINPGALVRIGDSVYAGTQGAGLLRIDRDGTSRPVDWPAAQVSALARDGKRLLAGGADGTLWSLPL